MHEGSELEEVMAPPICSDGDIIVIIGMKRRLPGCRSRFDIRSCLKEKLQNRRVGSLPRGRVKGCFPSAFMAFISEPESNRSSILAYRLRHS